MLCIMRHGKTDWNQLYKLQGRTDIPLNDEGRRMAIEAAERYRDVAFDICFASPLRRAWETAELFCQGRNIPIEADERLKEMCFGIYEGLDHIFEMKGHPAQSLFFDPVHYVVPEGGETFEEVFARTGEFLEEKVMPLHREGKRILIVGHGAMNLTIVNRIQNRPLEKFWEPSIKNCKLIQLL